MLTTICKINEYFKLENEFPILYHIFIYIHIFTPISFGQKTKWCEKKKTRLFIWNLIAKHII